MLVAVTGTGLWARSATATETDAARFVGELANRALEQLTESGISDSEREDRMQKILNDGFDLQAIARFVLGVYWPRATPTQQEDFTRLYERLVVRNYAALFRQYSGETLTVGEVRKIDDTNAYIVLSQIDQPGGKPPIPVEWRVRQSEPTDPRIVDVKVEGVSMPVTHRNEYAAVIRRQGGRIDDLLAALRTRLGEPDTSQAKQPR
ncbi:MAG: ABC transporter substrate-binding protein [Alphaproteobacteria bacterium]